MRVKIHCKKFDTEFKMSSRNGREFLADCLVESKRLRKHISIDVHFRHHSARVKIDHHTNPYPETDISELLLTIIVLKRPVW